MKKKTSLQETMVAVLYCGAIVFAALIVLGFIGFEIALWVKYGSKPIDEIPAWVLKFLFGLKG